MGNVSLQIGKRIRLYRQTKKISLSDFSMLIHKSKSTLSKYENGEISIDVETLFEIASALEISASQLMGGAEMPKDRPYTPAVALKRQYLYIFDGRTNKIMHSLLETTEHENEQPHVTLFYNIPSFELYEKCKSLYFGEMYEHDFITNYSLQNQTNKVESVFMCSLKPFELSDKRIGLISGISSRNFLPLSAKFVMSDVILKENEELLQALMLSKEDLRLIKRFNMFIIDQMA